MAALFGQVLGLCAQAGLAGVAVLAVDGTKVHANASERATRDYQQLAEEVLKEAAEIDAAEDERFGIAAATSCRRSWPALRGARSGWRAASAGWMPSASRRRGRSRSARPARVREAKRRLEEELATEVRANAAYEAYRARGRMKNGRRFGSPPKPYTPPEQPTGKINVTDPDSRTLKTPRGFCRATTPRPSATSSRSSSPPRSRSARRTSARWAR